MSNRQEDKATYQDLIDDPETDPQVRREAQYMQTQKQRQQEQMERMQTSHVATAIDQMETMQKHRNQTQNNLAFQYGYDGVINKGLFGLDDKVSPQNVSKWARDSQAIQQHFTKKNQDADANHLSAKVAAIVEKRAPFIVAAMLKDESLYDGVPNDPLRNKVRAEMFYRRRYSIYGNI